VERVDHFVLADWIEPTGVNPPLDFDHPNSLDFDVDGSYVVSFRHMGEITKIDRRLAPSSGVWEDAIISLRSSTIHWGFSGQHSVRVLENGNLLVYDNGLRHSPPRAARRIPLGCRDEDRDDGVAVPAPRSSLHPFLDLSSDTKRQYVVASAPRT